MRHHHVLATLASLLLIAACCADRAPAPVTPPAPTASASGSATVPTCRLPAPKKSQDACTTDADCGPSQPCHAPECVARARSKPRTPDTVCTMILECGTSDANRCGCFEGRCALIPPPAPGP
jgi:hypothetical protein